MNGTSWAETTDLSVARGKLSGAGTATTGLAFGGEAAANDSTSTEEWNANVAIGAWATGGSLNTARQDAASNGTQTAALSAGGGTSPYLANTEQYDGTSWSEVNDLNTARYIHGSSGDTTTSSLVFGGYDGSAKSVATEEFALSAVTQTITTS